MPVRADHVRLLEEVLGRQDDVRLARGVGEELLDHDAEVEPAEGVADEVRLGVLRDGVAALDPATRRGGSLLLGPRAASMSRPSRAVEIDTRTTPSGVSGG